MSSTNKTVNYNLPVWVSSDKPSWINDLNPAFLTIDAKLKTISSGVASAQQAAQQASQAADTAEAAAVTAQQAADSAVALLVALGIINNDTAVAFKDKVDNAVPKHDILASYFDADAGGQE